MSCKDGGVPRGDQNRSHGKSREVVGMISGDIATISSYAAVAEAKEPIETAESGRTHREVVVVITSRFENMQI